MQQEERAYRLFTLGETPELADLNPDIEISPDNVGQRIEVPIDRRTQQIPNHHWTKESETPAKICDMYGGRLGSVLVSVPTNLTINQVKPDFGCYSDNETIFCQDSYYGEPQDVAPKITATIQDGRLEKVREIALMDQTILRVRSAIVDAIQRGATTAHVLIDHPYRKHHTKDGELIVFRDKVDRERMIAVIIGDVRLHKTIDEVLEQHTPGELGKVTEEAVRREWAQRAQTEKQALDFHGLKSFKFRPFPSGIPVTPLDGK
jgi:hypothetical protein